FRKEGEEDDPIGINSNGASRGNWWQGKHTKANPGTVPPDKVRSGEAVPALVGTKSGTLGQFSTFEQRMLQHLTADIASQEQYVGRHRARTSGVDGDLQGTRVFYPMKRRCLAPEMKRWAGFLAKVGDDRTESFVAYVQ
ncbi:hypothetical protein Goklo_025461, partial [Gossypium klotzschianum]|nr:hypothetical protein [Gossypium klotzschianum]